MPILPPAGMLPLNLDWTAVELLAKRYRLGHQEIDRQHRELFAWLIAVRAEPHTQQLIDGLSCYAVRHFEDEEQMAVEAGVDVAGHQSGHQRMIETLAALDGSEDRDATIALLHQWLTVHIDVEDRWLVRRMRDAGPGPPA